MKRIKLLLLHITIKMLEHDYNALVAANNISSQSRYRMALKTLAWMKEEIA